MDKLTRDTIEYLIRSNKLDYLDKALVPKTITIQAHMSTDKDGKPIYVHAYTKTVMVDTENPKSLEEVIALVGNERNLLSWAKKKGISFKQDKLSPKKTLENCKEAIKEYLSGGKKVEPIAPAPKVEPKETPKPKPKPTPKPRKDTRKAKLIEGLNEVKVAFTAYHLNDSDLKKRIAKIIGEAETKSVEELNQELLAVRDEVIKLSIDEFFKGDIKYALVGKLITNVCKDKSYSTISHYIDYVIDSPNFTEEEKQSAKLIKLSHQLTDKYEGVEISNKHKTFGSKQVPYIEATWGDSKGFSISYSDKEKKYSIRSIDRTGKKFFATIDEVIEHIESTFVKSRSTLVKPTMTSVEQELKGRIGVKDCFVTRADDEIYVALTPTKGESKYATIKVIRVAPDKVVYKINRTTLEDTQAIVDKLVADFKLPKPRKPRIKKLDVKNIATLKEFDKHRQAEDESLRKAWYCNEEEHKAFVKELQRIIDNSDIARVSSGDKLEKYIDNGFKSQIETHTSGGCKDVYLRKRMSKKLFGHDGSIASTEYEKYGVLITKDLAKSLKAAEWYGSSGGGKVVYRLKKSTMLQRTTYTLSDSLNTRANCAGSLADPSLAGCRYDNKLQYMSNMQLRIDTLKGYKDGTDLCTSGYSDGYFELQFHGQVTADDIESIVCTQRPTQRLIDKIKAKGIKMYLLSGDTVTVL